MKALAIKSSLFSCLKTYNKKTFMSDLMAGIIVGIVALPLSLIHILHGCRQLVP